MGIESHVFLFFDIEEIRELKVKEELKKKLSRQDREAREFAKGQDVAKFLTMIYEMADFYSGKIAKVTESFQQALSLRLELCLWREVQYQAYQLSKVWAVDPALPLVVNHATSKLLETAKRSLRLHEIAFEEVTLRDTGNGGREGDFAALSIRPSSNSIPGKVAKRLSEKGHLPTLLCYSPAYTGAQGWAGKLTEKALYVSTDFILKLELDPDTGHELSHWESARRLFEGELSPFHGDVLRGAQRPLPPSVGPYDGGVEFDELEAYGYNMLVAAERLSKARSQLRRKIVDHNKDVGSIGVEMARPDDPFPPAVGTLFPEFA